MYTFINAYHVYNNQFNNINASIGVCRLFVNGGGDLKINNKSTITRLGLKNKGASLVLTYIKH